MFKYLPHFRALGLSLTLAFFVKSGCYAQEASVWENAELPAPSRLRWVGLGAGGTTVTTYGLLGAAWFGDDGWTRFRFFDDWRQWQQIDKIGHAYGAYQVSRTMMAALRWAGASERTQFWYGGLSGFVYQLPIEILDGFSPNYGASWGDLSANAAGSGLALLNFGVWREHRISLRFSYSPTNWAAQAPQVLGDNHAERLLKDYNGQTYWLSAAPAAWLPDEARYWPKWLCLSVGMGGEGMIGGYGREPRGDIRNREHRQWYLSLDVDWTRIKTRKRGLKLLFFGLQAIKLPAPALEWNRQQGWQGHWLRF